MRTIYFILLAVFFCSCATFNMVSAPEKSEIIELNNTKDELYIKANQWMVKTFNNAKSVIQFQDKESGKIFGKYLMKSIEFTNSDAFALISITVKDNGAKISIEPMGEWKNCNNCSGWNMTYKYTVEDAQADIDKMIVDFKKFMSANKDEWSK